MSTFILFYIIFQVTVLGGLLLLSRWKDKRSHEDHNEQVPPGFERTEEVSIDPISRVKRRVYYNPRTGERYYRIEK
ncbi:hypothetical protein [Brevibacillus dissolubilis]|uniref:hypothetical protein n=1 Tax=Brevibacillus dissolubilis TaxID=1844116 RepID=UPI001115B5DE|nr:hypothetical protein [Brevibacillus dissolubilis]